MQGVHAQRKSDFLIAITILPYFLAAIVDFTLPFHQQLAAEVPD
jgi:hypothetical protein